MASMAAMWGPLLGFNASKLPHHSFWDSNIFEGLCESSFALCSASVFLGQPLTYTCAPFKSFEGSLPVSERWQPFPCMLSGL